MDQKLAMKIFNVMDESEGIEKNMTVGSGNNSYSAISEKAVLNAIKPLLKKYKLIIIPIEVDISERLDTYQTSNTFKGVTTINDKARLMTQLKTKWKIIDAETGEFEILSSPGNGADTQDKASGKAWTYAYKAVLQKTFMLFSGEDTDNTHSDDIGSNSNSDGNKGDQSDEAKITGPMLLAKAKKKGFDEKGILAKYKKDTGKTVSEVKFISEELKKAYYLAFSKFPDKE